MTLDEFEATLEVHEPPAQLSELLRALWYDHKGEWDTAHRIAQSIPTSDGSWVHAYLHRKEGDLGNARYWYSRASRPESRETLDLEWRQLAVYLAAKAQP